MTAVTATPNAEATADRELPLLPLISEGITVSPDPVQVTIHVDVARIFEDCKTIRAFDEAMTVVLRLVEAAKPAPAE